MKRHLGLLALVISAVMLLWAHDAPAFQKEGCGTGECRDCHSLSRDEASKILGGLVDNVINVEDSLVKGLWVVDILKQGKKFPIYIDYSKGFLISGQVVRIATKEDITGARFEKLNAVTVDLSGIPLEDAIVMGNPAAKKKIVVFSDPDCHFCGKLHHEMKIVLEKDKDVAFFVKLYSRNNNPASAEKARAVICSKSQAMMEDAYAGKKLPPAACATQAVEETHRLAEKLGIRGTPSFVLPDGKVVNGFRPADVLTQLIAEAASPPSSDAKTGGGGKK